MKYENVSKYIADVDALLNHNRFISLYMHSVALGVEKDGVGG